MFFLFISFSFSKLACPRLRTPMQPLVELGPCCSWLFSLSFCVASIPTQFDPALAPPGKAVVHAYTAGNEPYSVWEGLKRGSKEYEDLKQERSQTLWKVRGCGGFICCALCAVCLCPPVHMNPQRVGRATQGQHGGMKNQSSSAGRRYGR